MGENTSSIHGHIYTSQVYMEYMSGQGNSDELLLNEYQADHDGDYWNRNMSSVSTLIERAMEKSLIRTQTLNIQVALENLNNNGLRVFEMADRRFNDRGREFEELELMEVEQLVSRQIRLANGAFRAMDNLEIIPDMRRIEGYM